MKLVGCCRHDSRQSFPYSGGAKAIAKEGLKGGIEKKDITIGFIPITCATPIIMSEPMGFYRKHGLNATVRRASGWAMVCDWAINKEVSAAHMLSPMPLSISLGVGSAQVPLMPALENINGQAITLANKHQGVKTAQDMKGFRFCVPFDFSMYNFLLRYFLAEGGVHPDKDVQIRVVPPPEMVANFKAGNVDGYLSLHLISEQFMKMSVLYSCFPGIFGRGIPVALLRFRRSLQRLPIRFGSAQVNCGGHSLFWLLGLWDGLLTCFLTA